MGYILPVNNEQYKQYANRTTRKDAPPMTIDPVYKTLLDKKLKEKEQQEENHKHFANKENKNKHEKETEEDLELKAHEMEAAEEIFHELTGKGNKFDEIV